MTLYFRLFLFGSATSVKTSAPKECNSRSLSVCMDDCLHHNQLSQQDCTDSCGARCRLFSAITVNTSSVLATVPEEFVGFGIEMQTWVDGVTEQKWSDPVFRSLASHLGPFTFRLGGITGDFMRYEGFNSITVASLDVSVWPSNETVFLPKHWAELKDFTEATHARVVFMLSELHGRDCHGNEAEPERCTGEWDTTNVADFLQAVKPDYGTWLLGFELGNSLTAPYNPHLSLDDTIGDMKVLAGLGKDMWAPEVPPPFLGASTDYCDNGQPEQYIKGAGSALSGFTFHSYPGQGGDDMPGQLLNLTWLRHGVFEHDAHANVAACVAASTSAGVPAYLTESNTIWSRGNCSAPSSIASSPCHAKGFLNGFWYVASLGQFARAGLTSHSRWVLSEEASSPYPTIFRDASSDPPTYSVATDYWIAVLHKRLMGQQVLDARGDAGLFYAACSAAPGLAGGVSIMYANPSPAVLELSPPEGAGWTDFELYALTSAELKGARLNGAELKLGHGGQLPDLEPMTGSGPVQLPAESYGFIVFPAVGAPPCLARLSAALFV